MIVDDNKRNYYCSMKFRFIKIDLESKTTYTCHAAQPHDIDFTWLSDNPGQLFNTPINITERNMMLVNQRNTSCEQNCWRAEDVGAVSPRMCQGGQDKTHFEISTQPEIVDLTIVAKSFQVPGAKTLKTMADTMYLARTTGLN